MPILVDAMPVKAGRLIAKVVMYGDDKTIVQVDVYLWAWPLAIDANHWPRKSIRTSSDPVYAPIIVDGLC